MNTPWLTGQAIPQPRPVEHLSPVDGGRPSELLFVNPPSPDGDTWVRCQHRAGQRAPDGAVWPQTALAQLAALFPDRRVGLIDANARRLGWEEFAEEIKREAASWYVTQVAGPTLENDLRGVALAKQMGAATVVFGPTATPLAAELLQRCPDLDYVLCGEPELTLRELVDTVDGRWHDLPPRIAPLCARFAVEPDRPRTLGAIRGLAWRHEGGPVINLPRPLIPHLDDLPLPAHELLPLARYGAPAVAAPSAAVVTARGCPERCSFCLKQVTYDQAVRARSPEHIVDELLLLRRLGVRHVYMQADLFTVCREQVAGLCRLLVREGLGMSWSCSLRPDAVDRELLSLMGLAGCRWITWAIEAGSEAVLRRAGKNIRLADVEVTLGWAQAAGIRNWGSFILGLPGETERTIRQTIELAKRLSLDRATFELAVPRPGTAFWREALAKGWLTPGRHWEQADVYGPAILNYPDLGAGRLEFWLEQAYREWALRPGSLWGLLKDARSARAPQVLVALDARRPPKRSGLELGSARWPGF